MEGDGGKYPEVTTLLFWEEILLSLTKGMKSDTSGPDWLAANISSPGGRMQKLKFKLYEVPLITVVSVSSYNHLQLFFFSFIDSMLQTLRMKTPLAHEKLSFNGNYSKWDQNDLSRFPVCVSGPRV